MIIIKKKDSNSSYIEYQGELCTKHVLLSILAKFPNDVKRINTNKWLVNNFVLEELKPFHTELQTLPWSDIGNDLKYEPYEYQKEYVYFGTTNDCALLLAPTGSGKTMIMIALYNELKKAYKVSTPGLVIVPASLKYQWVKEVSKFSNLKAKAIDTPSKAGKKFDAQFEDIDLMICNYETLKNKTVMAKLLEMNLEFMACDEIQRASNYKSGISKALYELNHLKYRYGLTATPIMNSPEGLFGIFNFINKDLFKTHGKFASNYLVYKSYGIVGSVKNVDHLKSQIGPYIFMKPEEEIAGQLPKLIVTPIYLPMSNKLKKVNDEIMNDLDIARKAAEKIENEIKNPKLLESNKDYQKFKAQILAYQTFAQELVDDPRLLNMSESGMANQYKTDGVVSPKLEALFDLVQEIIDAEETVCIFTRFERLQRLLVNELSNKFKNIKVAYVNGSMSSEERFEAAYTKFQDDPEYKVLIMTSAGNAGISLSKCKNLIEFDLAQSAADQTQRHGRVCRADSISRISNIYQLIVEDSWDTIAQRIIEKKQNYDNEIIKSL